VSDLNTEPAGRAFIRVDLGIARPKCQFCSGFDFLQEEVPDIPVSLNPILFM